MATQAVSFSDVQLAILRIWRATHPFGLGVRIIRNSGNAPLAAEVSHQDPTSSCWRLEVRSDRMILLTGPSGRWVMGSIEAALESVSKFEAEKRRSARPLQGLLVAGTLRDCLVADTPGV